MQKYLALRALPLLFLSALSCTNVYFKKPVPQSAQVVSAAPEALTGSYEFVDDSETESDPVKALFKNCVVFEKVNAAQLLVSWESRLAEKDLPKLEAQLEAQRAAGAITEYTLTGHFLMSTSLVPADDGTLKKQHQYVSLAKEGSWYVVTQSREPGILLDFNTATYTEMSVSNGSAGVFPQSDSLEKEMSALDARQNGKGYYFNLLKKDEPGWSLLYLQPDNSGGWILKTSTVKDPQHFKTQLGRYERITPFEALSESRYLIDPSDAGLDQLMADKDLFHTAFLRRLEP